MTASRSDLRRVLVVALVVVVVACKPAGLPPEPPEHDPANADAKGTKYEPSRDATKTSAFEGVKLGGGGHDHHHHGAKKAAPKEKR